MITDRKSSCERGVRYGTEPYRNRTVYRTLRCGCKALPVPLTREDHVTVSTTTAMTDVTIHLLVWCCLVSPAIFLRGPPVTFLLPEISPSYYRAPIAPADGHTTQCFARSIARYSRVASRVSPSRFQDSHIPHMLFRIASYSYSYLPSRQQLTVFSLLYNDFDVLIILSYSP